MGVLNSLRSPTVARLLVVALLTLVVARLTVVVRGKVIIHQAMYRTQRTHQMVAPVYLEVEFPFPSILERAEEEEYAVLESPERTDLVISMTLAETFLLLLCVVWYGHTAILRQDPLALLKERLAVTEKENERLNSELKSASDQIADLGFRPDVWRKLTGLETPPTPTPVVVAQWRKEAARLSSPDGSGGRGKPKCQDSNVVISASVVHGRFSVSWLAQSPELSMFLADSGRPQPKITAPLTDRGTRFVMIAIKPVPLYSPANPGFP